MIGIIGAGKIGEAVARRMVAAGHEIILSNSRGPASLDALVASLGPRARAGTIRDAANQRVVVLAVPWNRVGDALAGLPPWEGRILIDATNAVLPGFKPAELDGRTSSEVVAALAPGARLVKTLNTMLAQKLGSDPHQAGGRRVLFLSGDDADAKAEVARLIQSAGFATIDLGGLATGGRLQQFPGGPLPTLDLVLLP